MKKRYTLLSSGILVILLFTVSFTQAATRFSVATGNWNSTTTWSATSGGGSGASVPANGDIVVIEGGFTVTLNVNMAATISAITISAGSTFTATGTFTVSATTITVNGIYNNGSTGTVTITTMNVNSGGTYIHNIDGGTIPTATWSSSSNCNITGIIAAPSIAGFSQTFGNLTWNCNQTSGSQLSGGAFTIAGTLTISNTGSSTVQLVQGTGNTVTAGSYVQTGGAAIIGNNTGTGITKTLTVNGSFTLSGGTFDMDILQGGSGHTFTLNIGGNFTINGGTLTRTTTTSTLCSVNFNGSATQTFSKPSGAISGIIDFAISSGSLVDFGVSLLNGSSGTFTLNSGGTIITANTNATGALTTSGANGSVQVTGTRTYSAGANYTYDGTAAQVTGNGLNQNTPANITINNPGNAVTLSANTNLSGTLTVKAGSNLALSTFSLGAITAPSGVILEIGTTGSTISGTGALHLGGNVTVNYITGSSGAIISCPVSLDATRTFTVADNGSAATDLTISGVIGTAFSLTKSGAGTMVLSGANTYTGITTINTGTLLYGASNVIASADVTVSGGTLDLATFTETASGTLTVSNGALLRIGGTQTMPAFTTGYSLGTASTVEYYGTAQNVSVQTYGNLTLSGSGAKTAVGSFPVNGILNLLAANPSTTVGILVMGTNTLTMGASATTVGAGDVTGIVKRTSLITATSYTFGNQYTTIDFQAGGTLPTDVSVKITIGSVPAWKTDAIQRTYDIIRTGGSGVATMNLHYLDTELNGNTESSLVIWESNPLGEYGRSNYDLTNNWVGTSSLDITDFSTAFGTRLWTLGNTLLLNATWNGSINTFWGKPSNWTPFGVPSDLCNVIIPDAATTPNDPILNFTLAVGRLTLNSGAILNSAVGSTVTISGGGGAWSNNGGTFNPSTSTVIFTSATATYSGTTNFYNVTINPGAALTMGSGGTMSIAGTITNNGIWRASMLANNTVVYNGGSQTVLNPNGATPGYDNLILSGSGTKTMPGTSMNISGNFTLAGTATANAGAALTIVGNVLLGAGTTFNGSTFTHNVAGNWTNSGGTFTPGSSTIIFNGTSPQTITGATTFNNLTASGTANVTLGGGALYTASGALQVNNTAKLTVPPTGRLTVGGTTTLSTTDCLVLKSDATGTGSFIDNGTFSGAGTARMERYLTTNAWHYISSPISNAIAAVFFSDYLMTSDPTKSTGWGPWIVYYATPLQVLRGYAVWKPASNPGLEGFSGPLNTGNETFTGNRTATDPWAGWHLVGNPYASAIDLSTGITWDHFEAAAYFWDQAGSGNPLYSSGNYNVALASPPFFGTHTKYAPTEQGFFVHIVNTWSGNSTLTFTNSARVHDSEPFLKDAPVITNALLMIAQSSVNAYSDRLTVNFNPNTTASYDPGYDAYKLWGLNEAPQLYTRIGDTNVTCNSLPFEQKNMVIPMGFSCGLPGMYTLIADSLGTFDDAISISLEDLKLNTTQDLRTNPVYNFTYDTLDNANRFVLHFDNPTLGGKDLKSILPVQIYSFGSSVYIRSTDGTNLTGDVFIYDMIGRELYEGKLVSSALNRITPVIADGYYVVKVVTRDAVYSGKIYIAN